MSEIWDSDSIHIWKKCNQQNRLKLNINDCNPDMVTA